MQAADGVGDNVGSGLGTGDDLNEVGPFEFVGEGKFGEGFEFGGFGFVVVIEDGFEGAAFALEAGDDVVDIAAQNEPGEAGAKILVVDEEVEDFVGEVVGGDGDVRVGQEPEDIEKALVLWRDGVAAVEGEFPEAVGVAEGEGGRGREAWSVERGA
jgi:hypothetical protein